ncbi:MAG: RNA chaperone Hfq [Bacillota bacterium]
MRNNSSDSSVQNEILDALCSQNSEIVVYMINGFRLSGKLKKFDAFTLIMEVNDAPYIVYKHAISTIIPQNLVDSL